jgi:hypothetical protein
VRGSVSPKLRLLASQWPWSEFELKAELRTGNNSLYHPKTAVYSLFRVCRRRLLARWMELTCGCS